MFEEFSPISEAQWRQQIAKELKDRAPEALQWDLAPDVVIDPLDRTGVLGAPLLDGNLHWEIGEDIAVDVPEVANATALAALEGGCDSLRFTWDATPNLQDIEAVFKGVYPEFVSLYFAGNGIAESPSLVAAFFQKIMASGLPGQALSGGIELSPGKNGEVPDWRFYADFVTHFRNSSPNVRTLAVTVVPGSNAVDDLCAALTIANEYLEKVESKGVPAAHVAESMYFRWPVGTPFFHEIAKMRALHLLWFHLLDSWKIAVIPPKIDAFIAQEKLGLDANTNKIAAATIALSAAVGGAARITVPPSDPTGDPVFNRRMARNVQHLLRMESAIGEIMDPAAGSYYIDQLTEKMAAAAWAQFVATQNNHR